MHLCKFQRIDAECLLLLILLLWDWKATSQCSAIASTPEVASSCASSFIPDEKVASIDPQHQYSLAELIDIGERNNPNTRISWERAKQRAKALGIEKSEYYPLLAGTVLFADQRSILPFPEPLAPRGYITIELPLIEPQVQLQYLLLDFGARKANVDAAKAEAFAAGAQFIKANQDVAYSISADYYALLTSQERLQAAKDILKTAQITQDAAEARLANGRGTMPDVLNATAETAQARFDLETADGDEKIARVTLAEAIGVEPSADIFIDAKRDTPLPSALALPIEQLISRAMADRPDLLAQMLEIRRADDEIRAAKSAYWPRILLSGKAAQTSGWPTTDQSQGALGHASEPTWAAALSIEWTIFDGGARKNRKAEAESAERQAVDELRDKRDQATREVWTGYIAFRTALRQEEAAVALLKASDTSYAASLDAYKYGVKNLVDVVTAEKELATARLSSVSARSRLFTEAVRLESVTGSLLRNLAPTTTTQDKDGSR
ncbi:TolC family protein [Alloacidobacterium dinghuense]|uniref:TolC family protein n=1 Tax=Alloacidobacterium dinghuense TaxID=2763107 RepID=A0A7G8BLL9_9BACT|nr:TolC family protein [Alloacidobacterium dinghuense]QNI33439.1 TolC family protein [Alloacidobacterium dinghuense]